MSILFIILIIIVIIIVVCIIAGMFFYYLFLWIFIDDFNINTKKELHKCILIPFYGWIKMYKEYVKELEK